MVKLKRVLAVFGTRPEAIKMAPVIKELQRQEQFETFIAVTAQHRQMLDQVLELFRISPDIDLNIMSATQTLNDTTCRVISGLTEQIGIIKPDIVLVHGDTTTTFAAALSAFYNQVPIGHVEAGLRTGNRYSPYPEEINRKLTSVLSSMHFAPTELNKNNLTREGVASDSVYITGNTVIDALHLVVNDHYEFSNQALDLQKIKGKKLILLTCHRRENWGVAMAQIFSAIKDAIGNDPRYEIVYPVHLNPIVQQTARESFRGVTNIQMIEPMQYEAFSNLMSKAYLVLSDSGGIQEEAPALGKPVLVLRDTTERPEALSAGTVKLAGNNYKQVYETLELVLNNPKVYIDMVNAVNPYGDGKASQRIVKALLEFER
jgi:UDP-N-acetylglucosamine 2-epimerase (non-hydrolysing)